MSWTSGPWEIHDAADTEYDDGAPWEEHEDFRYGIVNHDEPAFIAQALELPDARLIAAAPEMADELGEAEEAPFRMQAIMRREGFVLDDLSDPMQKLAFTFYNELVERSSKADALLSRIRGEA